MRHALIYVSVKFVRFYKCRQTHLLGAEMKFPFT